RRTLRERPMPREFERYQDWCWFPYPAEKAAVQARSWYRVQAKQAEEAKHPSPLQVGGLRYLPSPVWRTRFGRIALRVLPVRLSHFSDSGRGNLGTQFWRCPPQRRPLYQSVLQ